MHHMGLHAACTYFAVYRRQDTGECHTGWTRQMPEIQNWEYFLCLDNTGMYSIKNLNFCSKFICMRLWQVLDRVLHLTSPSWIFPTSVRHVMSMFPFLPLTKHAKGCSREPASVLTDPFLLSDTALFFYTMFIYHFRAEHNLRLQNCNCLEHSICSDTFPAQWSKWQEEKIHRKRAIC